MRRVPIDHATLRQFIAKENVLGDREHRHQCQFLMNDDDAALFAIADVREALHLPFEVDFPLVGPVRIHTAQHLHESGLARAILTDDRMDFSSFDRQIDIIECFDTRKRLGDAAHGQDGLVRHAVS